MGIVFTLHLFSNTKANEKRAFKWGSCVNTPPVFCQQFKYMITKGPLTKASNILRYLHWNEPFRAPKLQKAL